MLNTFYIVASLMIVVALVIVLLPLLRRGRQCGRPRGVFGLALVVAFALPLASIGIYALVGTPAAINPEARQPPRMTIDQAIAQLEQRLQAAPEDLQGWLLLGQSYNAMKRPADAREAYGHALELAPDSADVMVAWAEADSMARTGHRIEGKSRQLLQKAVETDPHNQRGLWLLGISDYQAGHFVDAALTWRRLQVLLTPDSDVANAVLRQIAMANARAAGKSQAEAEALLGGSAGPRAVSSSASATADAPQLQVSVSLDPSLLPQLQADATVYVYARAVDGPPMPLAVTRLKASQLPTTVTLTDGMGMTPRFNLSSASQVTLTARVSRSGKATPQAGDLEGSAGPLDVHTHKPVSLVIDHAL